MTCHRRQIKDLAYSTSKQSLLGFRRTKHIANRVVGMVSKSPYRVLSMAICGATATRASSKVLTYLRAANTDKPPLGRGCPMQTARKRPPTRTRNSEASRESLADRASQQTLTTSSPVSVVSFAPGCGERVHAVGNSLRACKLAHWLVSNHIVVFGSRNGRDKQPKECRQQQADHHGSKLGHYCGSVVMAPRRGRRGLCNVHGVGISFPSVGGNTGAERSVRVKHKLNNKGHRVTI